MQGSARGGSKSGKVWGYGRIDDNLMALDETENLLLLQIRTYFMLQWSRHYRKFDEHNLMARLQFMIATAIRLGKVPPELGIWEYIPSHLLFSNHPVPRVMLEAHLWAVADYLTDKMVNPAHIRRAEHERRIRGEGDARYR